MLVEWVEKKKNAGQMTQQIVITLQSVRYFTPFLPIFSVIFAKLNLEEFLQGSFLTSKDG